MKKQIISILLVVALCMGMSITAMAAEDAFSVNYGMDNLPESRYSTMWVGDCIDVDTDTYIYEILSGEENVKLDIENKTLTFVKEGTTQIRVSTSQDASESDTYTFTISSEEEAYAEYLIPKSIKVGYGVGNMRDVENAYIYHNCLLNKSYGGMTSMDDFYSYGFVSGGWADPCFVDPATRTVTGYWSMTFTRPGTTYIKIEDDEPYAITVEEPVISTNLPKKVQIGTQMQMTTSLDNTLLEDKKIEEIKKRGIYDTKAALGYQPKVEIISGAELVERKDGDYSNILSSSENITFTGEGTVTFKVTYEMLPFEKVESGEDVYANEEVYYSPEATFSVEVTPEPAPSVGITDETGDGVTTDTSGLDLDSICKNNGLDLTENDVEIVVSQEKVAKENAALLEQKANKNGYSVKNVYEILMTLFSDGNKITELTDNFGSLKLSLYVGKEYAGQNAIVYQLHDGTEIITHDGLKVNKNGIVTITVDKLSTFAVAVKDTETSVTPTTSSSSTISNTTSTAGSVKTGDTENIILWGILCMAAVCVVVILRKKSVRGVGR